MVGVGIGFVNMSHSFREIIDTLSYGNITLVDIVAFKGFRSFV